MSRIGVAFFSAAVAVMACGWPSEAIAQPAPAAKSVSIDDVEHLLATLKGKSDGAVARKLTNLELTERANSIRLAHWESEFPGSRSRQALIVLADKSAFLDLPAEDVPSAAPPDRATQIQILTRAAGKVKNAITQFPNFYATRSTTHFEDTPAHQVLRQQSPAGGGLRSTSLGGMVTTQISYEPLHQTAKTSAIVTYRDGVEVPATHEASKRPKVAMGLTTGGEFGPMLIVVVGDALRNDVRWSHWEQGANGTLAVFKFAVPEERSSFLVRFPDGAKTDDLYPAYHGEITVDPSSGDIFRLTEAADFDPPRDSVKTALMVEYAPVEVGNRIYICPVRGVALSRAPVVIDHSSAQANPASQTSAPTLADAPAVQTDLNDVAFTQYHLFRSESRILPQ